jgi:serine/threonine-protein kinase HipA
MKNCYLGVGPQGRHATIDNAMQGCETFTLAARRAGELVSRVWQEVREWKVSFERSGVADKDIARINSAFRHLDDVSTREARQMLP